MHLKFEGINFLPELVLEETLAGGEAGLIRILLSSDKTRVRVGRRESVLMCDNYHQISCGETFKPQTGLARPHLAGRGVKVSIELNNYIVFSLLTLVTHFRLTEGTEK